jgi:hypothetical protein
MSNPFQNPGYSTPHAPVAFPPQQVAGGWQPPPQPQFPQVGPYQNGFAPQLPPSGQPPRRGGKRWVGVAVGAGVFAAVATLGTFADRDSEPKRGAEPQTNAGPIVEPGRLQALDLVAGDCYNQKEAPPAPGESQRITFVEAVPCTSPHNHQITAVIDYLPTDSLDDVRGARAEADCAAREAEVLTPAALGDTTLRFGVIVPSDAVTWSGKRSVACYVLTATPTTTSLLQ